MARIPPSVKTPGVRAAIPGTIEWRPMVVNWFGSMIIAGLCAPLLVWLTIYCIRTRRVEAKKRAKAAQMSQPTLACNDMEVQGDVTLSSVSPPIDHTYGKVPKRVNLRRWFGWWTSSSSSREYDRDPRVRINGDYTYTKREHFARFFGWWTCSEESAIRDESSRTGETNSESQQTSEVLASSVGSQSEVENFQMRFLISSPRESRPGRQTRAETLMKESDRGAHPSSGQKISIVAQPAHNGLVTQSHNTDVRKGKARQVDGLSEEDDNMRFNCQGQQETRIVWGSSSEENSGHWTIRKRTVGIAEACDWNNLRSELRKSIHSHMLLPDELPSDQTAQVSKRHQEPLKILQTSTDLIPPTMSLLRPPGVSSRLRKVCSSPNLHLAFERVSEDDEESGCDTTSSPAMSHSHSAPVLSPFQTGLINSISDDTHAGAQILTKTGVLSSIARSSEMKTQDAGAISAAFSFDKTRRSTLDVVTKPLDTDRQTLDDYEAESSIDEEICGRNISGLTFWSTQCESILENHDPSGDTDDTGLDNLDNYQHAKVPVSDEQHQPIANSGNPEFHPGSTPVEKISSKPTNGFPTISAGLEGHSGLDYGRFATLNTPKRRHSFPSTQKGIEFKSELDRKFKFCFELSGENTDLPDISRRRQSLAFQNSTFLPTNNSGNQYLVIGKTRGPRLGRRRSKGLVKSRKPTPFVTCDERHPPVLKKRKTMAGDWQTLSRLSEAQSLLSENDIPVKHGKNINIWCDGTVPLDYASISRCSEQKHLGMPTRSDHVIDCNRGAGIATKSTSPVNLPRSITPEKLSKGSSHVLLPENRQGPRCLSNRHKQDEAGVLRLTPVRIADREISPSPILTETQLRSGGSRIERAFTNQSWAEKARRRESMRRAGRLLGD